MKKSSVIVMVLMSFLSHGQIDEARMERDLKVAESALQSLLGSNQGSFFSHRDVQSNYVKGFGVIITTPYSHNFYNYRVRRVNMEQATIYSDSNGKPKPATGITVVPGNDENDKFNEAREEEITNAFRTFLVDYATLISQLKDGEKVVVKLKSDNFSAPFVSSWSNDGQVMLRTTSKPERKNTFLISGEITKSILDDIRTGKIPREQALEQVKISKSTEMESPKDIEIMSNIFKALYSVSTTETYWTSGMWNFDYTPDIGVIFEERFYSSRPKSFGEKNLHDMPTIGKSEITQNERDKLVKEMYPKFIADLKMNILDYGRTIKSLKPNEMVMVRAEMTECKGCGIPESVEIAVKGEVLKNYNSGIMDAKNAASRVTIKEIGKQ